jgi:4,5-dihydroxyphthalate decarboxylase
VAHLALSLALTQNARTRPIFDGRVSARDLDLYLTPLPASEMFWRQLKFGEFDVSEMSVASLTIATSQGPTDWVAFPIFTTRVFFHTDLIVRVDSGIERPEDLRGKRIGVPEYQQTRAVWVRGALRHEFGVLPQDLTWFMERSVERSHGGATSFAPPPGVHLTYVAADQDLGSMLLSGELDAAVTHFNERNLVDRALVDLRGRPEIRYLFADRTAEAHRYYAKTGFAPINHCMVVRRTLAEREPWIVRNIYEAMCAARAVGIDRSRSLLGPLMDTGLVARTTIDTDPMPYGLKANRVVLDTLMDYLVEQGLTQRRVALEEVFFRDAFAW